MSSHVAKIAISLPKETARKLSEVSHQTGKGRSALMLEALKLWFRRREEVALEDRYVKAYQKKPERSADIETFYHAGLSSFSKESW